MLVFVKGVKLENPAKDLWIGERKKSNHKLNPHVTMTSTPEFEPGHITELKMQDAVASRTPWLLKDWKEDDMSLLLNENKK